MAGYYEAGDKRATRVKDLFAAIAPRYDVINDLQSLGMHRRWKRRVVELANAKPGEKALDACCGTGDLALGLAKRGAQVTGLDFSPSMLQIAGQRAERLGTIGQGPGKVTFMEGDAQQLHFPDGTFDIVTVGYGLRNLAHWETGLREMCRVARPGARLLVLDFGKPPNPIWRGFYFGYLRCFVPLFGLLVARNSTAYSYILQSLKDYPAQVGVARCMQELGLQHGRVLTFLGGIMTINYGERSSGA